MTDQIEINVSGPIQGSIRPPGSKSITNRALICAALADGPSRLAGALDSEDTRVMIESLRALGTDIVTNEGRTEITLQGLGGEIPARQADLFLGNSGTSIRFLTSLVTLGRGDYRLDGVPRMRQRPIADLLEALNQLGANTRSENGNGCPPVVVKASGLPGGRTTVHGNISSQYLSSLLMSAPYAQHPVELQIEGELVSQPYVRMTLAVMRAFGIEVAGDDLTHLNIPQGRYAGQTYAIEPDASAASYWWAAAAITGGRVTVEGLSRTALQGDVRFCECLRAMGCTVEYGEQGITVTGGHLRGIEVDMNAISDTVQTLAAVAMYADSPTVVTGVAHNRHKETDRISDLARELRKLGAEVEELPDGLKIFPNSPRAAVIETYDDHRMAMSMALVGLRTPGVVILNPGCTAKTYPRFFDDLARLQNPLK